jgi:hypothetical protein
MGQERWAALRYRHKLFDEEPLGHSPDRPAPTSPHEPINFSQKRTHYFSQIHLNSRLQLLAGENLYLAPNELEADRVIQAMTSAATR